MKPPLLRLVIPGVLAVVAVGLIWANCQKAPDGSADLPPEAAELEAAEASPGAQQARHDADMKLLMWSVATREALADEVIAGRLTLLEAAAGFCAVDRVKERYLPAVADVMPGETAEERLCRRVLGFVEGRLEGSGRREAVVGRLEEDLREQFRRPGGLRLPEFRRPESIPWFAP
jgi:hypothetical protein